VAAGHSDPSIGRGDRKKHDIQWSGRVRETRLLVGLPRTLPIGHPGRHPPGPGTPRSSLRACLRLGDNGRGAAKPAPRGTWWAGQAATRVQFWAARWASSGCEPCTRTLPTGPAKVMQLGPGPPGPAGGGIPGRGPTGPGRAGRPDCAAQLREGGGGSRARLRAGRPPTPPGRRTHHTEEEDHSRLACRAPRPTRPGSPGGARPRPRRLPGPSTGQVRGPNQLLPAGRHAIDGPSSFIAVSRVSRMMASSLAKKRKG